MCGLILRTTHIYCARASDLIQFSDMDFDELALDLSQLHLSDAPEGVINVVMGYLDLKDRCMCSLVCSTWATVATAVTAATRRIIFKERVQELHSLQIWLEKYGSQLEVLQLHVCYEASLTKLPCAQLQDLLLHGTTYSSYMVPEDLCDENGFLLIDSRAWSDITAASKLTALSLAGVKFESWHADAASALAALPSLKRLTWCYVVCKSSPVPSDGLMLQQLTSLTDLELQGIPAEALEHLGSLTNLQHLSIVAPHEWAAAGCPGLEQLTQLTSLGLLGDCLLGDWEVPPWDGTILHLTALQKLDASVTTAATFLALQGCSALSSLQVRSVWGYSLTPLQLPALHHLDMGDAQGAIPISFLKDCKQLQRLTMYSCILMGPGTLVASSQLQQLVLDSAHISCDAVTVTSGPEDMTAWQQVFQGPGHLPHLTLLQLADVWPPLDEADLMGMAACCSSLQALHLDVASSVPLRALVRLPDLTTLSLSKLSDEQCSSLVLLTQLRALEVADSSELSRGGLQRIAALQDLTVLGFGGFEGSMEFKELGMMLEVHESDMLLGCSRAIINKVRQPGPCFWLCYHNQSYRSSVRPLVSMRYFSVRQVAMTVKPVAWDPQRSQRLRKAAKPTQFVPPPPTTTTTKHAFSL